MKLSPKCRTKKLRTIYTIVGSFCSFFNWEGANIGPQVRLRKIPHQECPCKTEKPYPRGLNLPRYKALSSPWLNSNPKGEISIFNMDRLMMDYFSSTFTSIFGEHEKSRSGQ